MVSTLTDTPQPIDILSQSQDQMLQNNKYYGNTLNVDHQIGPANGTRNDGIAKEGYHKVVHFVTNMGAPSLAEGELYTNTVSGSEQLFFQNSAGIITNLTGAIAPSPIANGFTTLPGGIILQWGVVSAPSGTGGPFSFPTAFNTFFSMSLTMDRSSGASTSYDIFLSGTPSETQFFTNSGTSGAHDVYFIAIGI